MQENEKVKMNNINFAISNELKKEFKMLLIKQEKSVSEVLSSLVEKYIEESQNEETIN